MKSQNTRDSRHFGDAKLESRKQVLADGVAIAPYGPEVCLQDANGNDIPETRGHVYRLAVTPDHEGYIDRDEDFSLVVDIHNTAFRADKAAFQRIHQAAEQLSDLARKIEVRYARDTGDIGEVPTVNDPNQSYLDNYQPPKTHTEREEIARQLSDMNDLLRIVYQVGSHPVHEGTADGCRYRCEMLTYADAGEFTEFHVSDCDKPLNIVISERLDGYVEYFMQLADEFRAWRPTATQPEFAKAPHSSKLLAEMTEGGAA